MKKFDNVLAGERQQKIVQHSLPWGIINPFLLLNEVDWISKRQRESYATLKKKGMLKEEIVNPNETIRMRYKRATLTNKGVDAFIASRSVEAPLFYFDGSKEWSIRGKNNTDHFQRWIRYADAQMFFASAGVTTIYEAVSQYHIDPFVFGNIEIDMTQERTTLTDIINDAMLMQIKKGGYPSLLDCYDTCGIGALFIPNYYIKFETQDPLSSFENKQKKKDAWKNTNNSIGILLDFNHHTAYLVFKFQPKTNKWNWASKKYRSICSTYVKTLRSLGMKNFNMTGMLTDAIILCETSAELEKKAKLSNQKRMNEPFQRVYLILMKQKGIERMCDILGFGGKKYFEETLREVRSYIRDTSIRRDPVSKDIEFFRTKEGHPIYIGTELNAKDISEALGAEESGREYVFVCYRDQVPFYKEIGIDENCIFVLPETE